MTGLLVRWIVNIAALLAVVSIFPGITVDRWETAVIAALVLGLLNAFVRPFLVLLTLPLHVMSLGVFMLFINALMFYAASKIVPGFYLANFGYAFFGAILFGIISFILNIFIDPHGRISVNVNDKTHFYRQIHKDVIDVEGKEKDDRGPT